MHIQRRRLDIDALEEEWRAIPGYEGFYEISSLGRARSVTRRVLTKGGKTRGVNSRILCQALNEDGYPVISVSVGTKQSQRTLAVHKLVLLAFRGLRPKGMESLHWDGNKENNRLSNLRYGSPLENWDDRKRHYGVTGRLPMAFQN